MDHSNYNKIKNGKRDPSVQVLQKLSVMFGIKVYELLNPYNPFPGRTVPEDKNLAEKTLLIEQLEEEDKKVIYKMIEVMLTKKKLQDFFQQNLATNY